MKPIQQQTLALAGMLQACCQVNDIANRGLTRQESTIASLCSILTVNADDLSVAIGTPTKIRYGLQAMIDLFDGDRDYMDALQYAIAVSQLQQSFAKNSSIQQAVASDLQLIERSLPDDENGITGQRAVLNDDIVSQLASTWTEHIRELEPQIVVQGKPLYLQNDNNVKLIRALLLAALRCSWLWRQVGGRRWHLIVKRGALKQSAQQLLHI